MSAKKTVKKVASKLPARKAPARRIIHRTSKPLLDILEEAPDPLLELLAGAGARVRGFHLIYRSSSAARESGGYYGFGTAGVWRMMHASFEEAVDYVENSRERGVNWEIHPWPALRLAVGKTDLLLAPLGASSLDRLPEILLCRLRKREPFDFWAFKWLMDNMDPVFEVFMFPKNLPKLGERDLGHYHVSESVGSQYRLMWRKAGHGLGKGVLSKILDSPDPPTGRRVLFEVLKSELSKGRAEYSIVDSVSGKVLIAQGRKVTAAHVESVINRRDSLKVLPERSGGKLLELIKLYSPYVR